MPERSVRTIEDGFLADLPDLYHNLMTDKDLQKRSLSSDHAISLTPWEAFTLFFLRSLGTLKESVQPFFNCDSLFEGAESSPIKVDSDFNISPDAPPNTNESGSFLTRMLTGVVNKSIGATKQIARTITQKAVDNSDDEGDGLTKRE